MKSLLTLILAAALLALTGCASTNSKDAGAFLAKVAAMNVTAADVTQTTTGPFYNHQESISGLHWDAKGFSVENLKASFNIPLPVFGVPLLSWSLSASAIAGVKPDTPVSNLAAVMVPVKP